MCTENPIKLSIGDMELIVCVRFCKKYVSWMELTNCCYSCSALRPNGSTYSYRLYKIITIEMFFNGFGKKYLRTCITYVSRFSKINLRCHYRSYVVQITDLVEHLFFITECTKYILVIATNFDVLLWPIFAFHDLTIQKNDFQCPIRRRCFFVCRFT